MRQVIKILSFPVLLFASLFSEYAKQYELAVTLAVCVGALVLAVIAIRDADYIWSAELTAIAIVFSPVLFLSKLFLLMGLAFIVASLALWSALHREPASAWETETE